AAPIIIYPIINHRDNHSKEIWTHLDQETRDLLKIQDLPSALVPVSNKQPTLFNSLKDRENSEQEMDDLNVLYVALTRPKDKLLIYCESKIKSSKSKTKENAPAGNDYISMLVQFRQSNAIRALPSLSTSTGDNNQDFAIGTDDPKPAEPNTTTHNTTIEVLDQLSFADWSQKISIADQSKEIFGNHVGEAIDHGNAVHEILSHICTKNDIDQATHDYCRRQRIHTDIQSRLLQEVRLVVTDPQCKPFFASAATIKTECDIAFDGQVKRPDRIIFNPDSTLVVDFKTGKEQPNHNQQVKEYCDAIRQMGYPHVRGFLIYISTNGITVREV
ncbi:MAG: hypothetical protein KBT04_06155, partial [Bacteroidales bacterium]|nr:hypothetical protein [Candidatus Colimorpha onthohippi]